MSWNPYKRHCDCCGKYYEGRGKHFCSSACYHNNDPATRFWDKVESNDLLDCWTWIAAKSGKGYGHMEWDGRTQKAHRISWQMAFGKIPEGMIICHKCDNPSCVNPAHLFLGTHSDNMIDMYQKGRGADIRGERAGGSKLTEKDVLSIRELRSEGFTHKWLAKKFGVSRRQIGKIVNMIAWKHI